MSAPLAFANPPRLETERLILRPPQASDAADEMAFLASDRAAGIGGPFHPMQAFRSVAGLIGHWGLRGYGFFALEEKTTGRYMGRVGPWFPEGWPEPEIGWSVVAEAEGKGYAYEAALASRAWAYDALGWTTAISLVEATNDRSAALARRMGCTQDGTWTHPLDGWVVDIWRHPAPEAAA
ncbi:MAG: GNAT family N-acetyltransferase [Pseudomonadota bacterium]